MANVILACTHIFRLAANHATVSSWRSDKFLCRAKAVGRHPALSVSNRWRSIWRFLQRVNWRSNSTRRASTARPADCAVWLAPPVQHPADTSRTMIFTAHVLCDEGAPATKKLAPAMRQRPSFVLCRLRAAVVQMPCAVARMGGGMRLHACACGRAAAALRRRAGAHAAPEEHRPLHLLWPLPVQAGCRGLVIVSGLFLRSGADAALLLCLLLPAAPRRNAAPLQRHGRAERSGHGTLLVPSRGEALLNAASLLPELCLPTSPSLSSAWRPSRSSLRACSAASLKRTPMHADGVFVRGCLCHTAPNP